MQTAAEKSDKFDSSSHALLRSADCKQWSHASELLSLKEKMGGNMYLSNEMNDQRTDINWYFRKEPEEGESGVKALVADGKHSMQRLLEGKKKTK